MGIRFREMAAWTRSRKFLATAFVAFTLTIGILIGTMVSGGAGASLTSLTGGTSLGSSSPAAIAGAFSEIVKRNAPAVVNISTTQVIARRGSNQRRGTNGDPFQDFFNRFFDSPEQGPEAERSLGSGMIVDKSGLILTNNHVIAQATNI